MSGQRRSASFNVTFRRDAEVQSTAITALQAAGIL